MSTNLVGNTIWWFGEKEHLVQSTRLKLAINVPSRMSQDAVQDGQKEIQIWLQLFGSPFILKLLDYSCLGLVLQLHMYSVLLHHLVINDFDSNEGIPGMDNIEGINDVELPGGIPNSLVLSSLVAKQLMLGGKCFHY